MAITVLALQVVIASRGAGLHRRLRDRPADPHPPRRRRPRPRPGRRPRDHRHRRRGRLRRLAQPGLRPAPRPPRPGRRPAAGAAHRHASCGGGCCGSATRPGAACTSPSALGAIAPGLRARARGGALHGDGRDPLADARLRGGRALAAFYLRIAAPVPAARRPFRLAGTTAEPDGSLTLRLEAVEHPGAALPARAVRLAQARRHALRAHGAPVLLRVLRARAGAPVLHRQAGRRLHRGAAASSPRTSAC